jgi:hypothetical protein
VNTYDPIVDYRELPRFRFSVSDLRAKAHTALVLVSPTGEMLKVGPGAPVPKVRTGAYREAYFIDVAEHQLQMECKVPCSDGVYNFNASVGYRCRVAEPRDVVAHRCRDAAVVFEPLIKRALRRVARKYEPDQAGQAEDDANKVLQVPNSLAGFYVTECFVELSLDGDEAAYVREKRKAGQRRELDKGDMDVIRPLVAAGKEGLLARHLLHHPDDWGAVYDLINSHEYAEADQRLEALRLILSTPDSDDDFEMAQIKNGIASTIAERLRGGRPNTPPPALSGKRLRGTIFGAATDGEPGPADPPAPPYRRDADGAPRNPDADD